MALGIQWGRRSGRTRVARRVLATSIVGLAIAPVAHASAAPHVVIWSGALTPGTAAQGVEVQANGRGRRLIGDEAGAIHDAGAFAPKGARLAAIRSAASALLTSGPSVSHANAADGGYVSVLLEDGGRRRAVVDSGADSGAVVSLLSAVNAALPSGSRLAGASPASRVGFRSRTAPTPAACPPGQQATDVVKTVPMTAAASSGLVQLTPKGRIGGDSVAVDGTWKPVKAPTTITVHLEIARAAGDGTNWAPLVKGKLDAAYSGYKVDGQPVTFNFDVVNAAPGGPRPCYHEILMHIPNDVRSYVTDVGPAVQGGEWSAPDARAWAHEVGHLVGVADHYSDYFHINKTGADVKLPSNGLEGANLQAALPRGIKATDGRLTSKPWKGYENDLMATAKGHLRQRDLSKVVAGADILVYDGPGDVLANKHSADQNLVTGAFVGLRIPKGKTAHIDGVVAYCIDLGRHVPGLSTKAGFDVLGPAGAFGTESMSALQRVMDVIAAREPGPLQATPGANDAVWRVTDDSDPSSAAAISILDAAGVPRTSAEKTYNAAHLNDPNAANPQTQALTPAGAPLPALEAPVEGLLPTTAKPTLAVVGVAPRRLRAVARRASTLITAQVSVDGAPDQVSVLLTRTRRGRTVTVAHLTQTVAVGQELLSLRIRGLAAGAYRLVVQDASTRGVPVRVKVLRAAGRRRRR